MFVFTSEKLGVEESTLKCFLAKATYLGQFFSFNISNAKKGNSGLINPGWHQSQSSVDCPTKVFPTQQTVLYSVSSMSKAVSFIPAVERPPTI